MYLNDLTNHFILERERLVLWVPVLFGGGICLYFSLPIEPLIFPVLFVFAILSLTLFCFRHRPIFFVFLSFWIIVAGFLDIQIQTKIQSYKLSFIPQEQTTYLKGRIFKTDFSSKGKTRLWLKDVSDFENARKGIYRITLNTKAAFQTGDCVETVATFSKPSPPLIVHGFDFERHAFYQGVSAIGYTESGVYQAECQISSSPLAKFHIFLNTLRTNITNRIFKRLKGKSATIASVLLVGNKNLISDKLYEQYRNAGLAHFLSISGLHMGFVTVFAFFFVRLLMALIPYLTLHYSSKKVASVFAIFFSFIYLMLSGANVPAVRAFLMSSFVLTGVLLDREAISMRMLCMTTLVVLICEPYIILSASFKLSFAAVLGLISFYEIYSKHLYAKSCSITLKVVCYFIAIFFTTLIATLSTLPFSLYHFGTLAPYTIIGNLLATPLVAFIIMPSVFLSLLFLPFSSYPLQFAGFGLNLLNHLTSFISSLPFSSVHLPQIPLFCLLFITFGLLWLCLWQRRWRLYGLLFIIVGFAFCFTYQSPDILYSSNGKTVGIKTAQNELLIFSKKKNNFLNEIWSQNHKSTALYKKLQSVEDIGLKCDETKCTYKNIFEFDLDGNLTFNGQFLDPKEDLGGAIYLKDTQKLLSIRQTIGNRIWNK